MDLILFSIHENVFDLILNFIWYSGRLSWMWYIRYRRDKIANFFIRYFDLDQKLSSIFNGR